MAGFHKSAIFFTLIFNKLKSKSVFRRFNLHFIDVFKKIYLH